MWKPFIIPDWESLWEEGLGTNSPCSKLDLTPRTLRTHSTSVHASVVRLFWLPPYNTWLDLHYRTKHLPWVTSPKSTTYHDCIWPSKEKPHPRILLAPPGLSAAVCVWLWLSPSLQEKNQMFPVRPSCDSGAVTLAFRERRVILQRGIGPEG